MTIGKFQFWSF